MGGGWVSDLDEGARASGPTADDCELGGGDDADDGVGWHGGVGGWRRFRGDGGGLGR